MSSPSQELGCRPKFSNQLFLCRWEHLIYQLGGHQELIRYVVIKGTVVHDNDKTLDL